MIAFSALFFKLFSILIGLLGITFIVVFHELGHFIFCKIFKVHTPTFSIGIGKILFSKKIGDTNFCISAGPIGGYVQVASHDGENNTKGFNSIPYYQKVLIMLGGISFNFILAYIFFVGLFFTGMPDTGSGPYEAATCTIADVASTSINSENIQAGDILIAIGDKQLNNSIRIAREAILSSLAKHASTISATVKRNGSLNEITLNLKGAIQPAILSKQLEITLQKKPALSLKESFFWAWQSLNFYLHAIIQGLKDMVSGKHIKGFIGPVMAVAASSKSAEKGADALFFLLAIISLNLGFMNLLPLPIFDGGQFVIFTIEAITRRELSEKMRNAVAFVSWALAIGLLVIFTIKDIWSLFWA